MFQVSPLPLDTPVSPDKLRFVCLSDTHSNTHFHVPTGDVLLHAGDFTKIGLTEEVKKFNDFLSKFTG